MDTDFIDCILWDIVGVKDCLQASLSSNKNNENEIKHEKMIMI